MTIITKVVPTTIHVDGKANELCSENCSYVDREDAFCTRYQKALNDEKDFADPPYRRCADCRKEMGNNGW